MKTTIRQNKKTALVYFLFGTSESKLNS